MKQAWRLSLLLLLATGCAGHHPPPQTVAAIRHEPVAAAFCMSEKGIHYSELVYKVFFQETVSHDSVFDGLWDIDSELSGVWASQLPRIGIRSQPIDKLMLNPAAHSSFCTALEPGAESVTILPEVRHSLLKHHVRYLLLLRAQPFRVNSYSMLAGMGQVHIVADLVIQNIQTNEQEYLKHVSLSGNVSFGDSPRNLEANELALLKHTAHKWVSEKGLDLVRTALDIP